MKSKERELMSTIEIPKNSQETLRLQVSEFRGRCYADLRVYYRDEADQLRPTRKGLTLSPDLWPDFLKGVEQLTEEMKERGLLPDSEN